MKRFPLAVLVTILTCSFALAAGPNTPQGTKPAAASPATQPARPFVGFNAGKPLLGAAPASTPAATAQGPDAGKAELIRDTWDWQEAMRQVDAGFTGTPGVVIHIGDSMTYSASYGRWARKGEGRGIRDAMTLDWMHTEKQDDTDGWYLAAFDVKEGNKMMNRSYTAASGLSLADAIKGGHNGLPPLQDILKKYNPQIAVVLLGTVDATDGRSAEDYKADLEKAVGIILANHTIPVLNTLPPHYQKLDLVQQYNKAIVQVATQHKVPLIDLYGEIVSRQPGRAWYGTLLSKNSTSLSASTDGVNVTSEPTTENLAKVGYLLRCYLTVQKMTMIKMQVVDILAMTTPKDQKKDGASSQPAH